MKKLSNIVQHRLNHHNLGESGRAAEIIYVANNLLNQWLENVDQNVKAMQLKNTILLIGTKNAGWAQEVWGISEKLLLELQKQFGKKIVTKIRTKDLTST